MKALMVLMLLLGVARSQGLFPGDLFPGEEEESLGELLPDDPLVAVGDTLKLICKLEKSNQYNASNIYFEYAYDNMVKRYTSSDPQVSIVDTYTAEFTIPDVKPKDGGSYSCVLSPSDEYVAGQSVKVGYKPTEPDIECISHNEENLTCTWHKDTIIPTTWTMNWSRLKKSGWYQCPHSTSNSCSWYSNEENSSDSYRPHNNLWFQLSGTNGLGDFTKVYKKDDIVKYKPSPVSDIHVQEDENRVYSLNWSAPSVQKTWFDEPLLYRINITSGNETQVLNLNQSSSQPAITLPDSFTPAKHQYDISIAVRRNGPMGVWSETKNIVYGNKTVLYELAYSKSASTESNSPKGNETISPAWIAAVCVIAGLIIIAAIAVGIWKWRKQMRIGQEDLPVVPPKVDHVFDKDDTERIIQKGSPTLTSVSRQISEDSGFRQSVSDCYTPRSQSISSGSRNSDETFTSDISENGASSPGSQNMNQELLRNDLSEPYVPPSNDDSASLSSNTADALMEKGALISQTETQVKPCSPTGSSVSSHEYSMFANNINPSYGSSNGSGSTATTMCTAPVTTDYVLQADISQVTMATNNHGDKMQDNTCHKIFDNHRQSCGQKTDNQEQQLSTNNSEYVLWPAVEKHNAEVLPSNQIEDIHSFSSEIEKAPDALMQHKHQDENTCKQPKCNVLNPDYVQVAFVDETNTKSTSNSGNSYTSNRPCITSRTPVEINSAGEEERKHLLHPDAKDTECDPSEPVHRADLKRNVLVNSDGYIPH